MISQFAGVAALVVVTACVGVIGYVIGRFVSMSIYRKQIDKIIKTATEEVVKIHNTYAQFTSAYHQQPAKVKNPNLSIVRKKDNPPE